MSIGNQPTLGNFQRIAQDFVPLPQQNFTIPNTTQQAEIEVVYSYIVAKASDDDPVCVFATLEGSIVKPGTMAFDQLDKRGYYQDSITVALWLSASSDVNTGGPAQDFLRVQDGPGTVNGTGSSSTSLSVSISANVSGGFFGGVPTANVGGGVGQTETHSYSHSLQDFQVTNDSDFHLIKHTYAMAQSAQGVPYSTPTDLWPEYNHENLVDDFKGTHLNDPPPMAKSNLNLHSMAFWKATHTRDLASPMFLHMDICQNLSYMEGTNYPLRGSIPTTDTAQHDVRHVVALPVDGLPATKASGQHVNWGG